LKYLLWDTISRKQQFIQALRDAIINTVTTSHEENNWNAITFCFQYHMSTANDDLMIPYKPDRVTRISESIKHFFEENDRKRNF